MLSRKYRITFAFSVPIKKVLDNGQTIAYKLKFIDSFRFMSTSLSKLLDNLSEIYSKKCGYKNCKSECEFKYNKLSYNCKERRKKQLKPINGLTKNFPNTYKFCNNNINKFILLLIEGIYPYEFVYPDVFESFINKCIEIYKLVPAHFLSTPGLTWQTCLKKTGVKLELSTNNDMLMMAEKGI